MGLDRQVFLTVQSMAGEPFLDGLMALFAEALVLLVPLSLVYLWFQDEEAKIDSIFCFSSVILGISLTYFLGLFYFHEPPQYQGFDTILVKEMENAFPSQHTAVVFSAFWPLWYLERRMMAILIFLASVLTGFARVYTGLHFPVDILGGILASLMAFGLVYLTEDILEDFSRKIIDLYLKTLSKTKNTVR